MIDDRPKSLRKRFFDKLRHWALAWERRRQYLRGRAEARVIIDQYSQSPHKYIDGVTLHTALQRRKDELWDEWNGRSFRLSTRAGFDSECDFFRAQIHATRPGA